MESLSTGQSSLDLIAHTALDYLRLLPLFFFICIGSSNELKMATRNAVFFFSL